MCKKRSPLPCLLRFVVFFSQHFQFQNELLWTWIDWWTCNPYRDMPILLLHQFLVCVCVCVFYNHITSHVLRIPIVIETTTTTKNDEGGKRASFAHCSHQETIVEQDSSESDGWSGGRGSVWKKKQQHKVIDIHRKWDPKNAIAQSMNSYWELHRKCLIVVDRWVRKVRCTRCWWCSMDSIVYGSSLLE